MQFPGQIRIVLCRPPGFHAKCVWMENSEWGFSQFFRENGWACEVYERSKIRWSGAPENFQQVEITMSLMFQAEVSSVGYFLIQRPMADLFTVSESPGDSGEGGGDLEIIIRVKKDDCVCRVALEIGFPTGYARPVKPLGSQPRGAFDRFDSFRIVGEERG